MPKPKIIHIITKMELGGAQQNTLFTVSHLDPEKFDTFLLTGPEGELMDETRKFPRLFIIPDLIREIRPLKDLKAFFQIKKTLQQIKNRPPESAPIIVHTHSSKAGILGRWAAKAAGINTTVHSIHGFPFHDFQPFLKRKFYIFLEKLSAKITTRFIAVSAANIEEGIKHRILEKENTALIRSGIDIFRFESPNRSRNEVRKELGIAPDAKLVLMPACLKAQKAPLDFVKACFMVKQRVDKAVFVHAGDGILRPEVETAINKLGLQNSFRLLGWRRDIPELIHAADVVVLTSRWEGLPRVIPQAMAASRPVVVTRVNGSPEAVQNGKTGFLVSPGNIEEIADKIALILEQPEKGAEMGKTGKLQVRAFDIHKMVRDQERLYGELLNFSR